MVGHTGVIPAAVKAIETVDACLAEVVAAVHASGGACLITADHGNADHMLEPDGSPNTAHSLNPVPVIVTVPGLALRGGRRARRRRPDAAGAARHRAAGGDDRASLIDGRGWGGAVAGVAVAGRESGAGGLGWAVAVWGGRWRFRVGGGAITRPVENLHSTPTSVEEPEAWRVEHALRA